MRGRRGIHIGLAAMAAIIALLACPAAASAQRQGDRFGVRVGAWPQQDIAGSLGYVYFHEDPDTLYRAAVEEDGQIAPFLELYGLFNVKGIWWVEIGAGFAQRNDVQVDGIQEEPPITPVDPKGDTSQASKILFGDGRVDFIPLFLGARAIHELGTAAHPHNIYARGGISVLIASEQPSNIHPRLGRSVYSEGTKAALGFLIGAGGEYYLSGRFGLVGDIAYRLSDLNYSDDGNFDLSSLWASVGVTLRVR
ncbi:MAG TPA: hypothetical protein VNN55_06535 [bacterium]|nr:hypothetical protein [bacterium]